MAHLFTQIAIGIHGTHVSVLNMNLTDSVVDRSKFDEFVQTCLVPKLFVPITPLLPSQFEIGRCAPELLAHGAPLFHFHGYPQRGWFAAGEAFVGTENPAVLCGTAEAGVFNFQAMVRLARQYGSALKLGCLIEPDHGTNILARDNQYLVTRVRQGVERGQLQLGGQAFSSLRGAPRASTVSTQAVGTSVV